LRKRFEDNDLWTWAVIAGLFGAVDLGSWGVLLW
jgi:hypothetical protein